MNLPGVIHETRGQPLFQLQGWVNSLCLCHHALFLKPQIKPLLHFPMRLFCYLGALEVHKWIQHRKSPHPTHHHRSFTKRLWCSKIAPGRQNAKPPESEPACEQDTRRYPFVRCSSCAYLPTGGATYIGTLAAVTSFTPPRSPHGRPQKGAH